jgi:5-hydroxyisourate hydrolase
MTLSPITTHVLDTALGKPARGVAVRLEIEREGEWHEVGRGTTNEDGRVVDLLAPGALEAARYRITFGTGAYFAAAGARCFYPYVEIVFAVDAPGEHHHVPLLLSPFGYTTYRGS